MPELYSTVLDRDLGPTADDLNLYRFRPELLTPNVFRSAEAAPGARSWIVPSLGPAPTT
jgi:hypothetical protein